MVETCNSSITTGGGIGWVAYMHCYLPGYYRLLKLNILLRKYLAAIEPSVLD
jgi:hypothetical protein